MVRQFFLGSFVLSATFAMHNVLVCGENRGALRITTRNAMMRCFPKRTSTNLSQNLRMIITMNIKRYLRYGSSTGEFPKPGRRSRAAERTATILSTHHYIDLPPSPCHQRQKQETEARHGAQEHRATQSHPNPSGSAVAWHEAREDRLRHVAAEGD